MIGIILLLRRVNENFQLYSVRLRSKLTRTPSSLVTRAILLSNKHCSDSLIRASENRKFHRAGIFFNRVVLFYGCVVSAGEREVSRTIRGVKLIYSFRGFIDKICKFISV